MLFVDGAWNKPASQSNIDSCLEETKFQIATTNLELENCHGNLFPGRLDCLPGPKGPNDNVGL
ncbi:hypothetical protein PGT21_031185 [Puccinia graminis f. sp. tritici]|uniref:Uncharacterized protein n=1 Tax=Puccinia graminis f. sp. tritici TaxID=56615 RepID=A0A5B0QCF3_PUCGR|nr:hypothetical protein PGT21_031185 [Puccinia graminis f. sp. tritici]